MADTKISALTAASAAALANEFAINEAGTSKKLTLQQALNGVDVLADAAALADANKLLVVQSGVAKDAALTALITYLQTKGMARIVHLDSIHSISSATGTEVTGLGITLEAGTFAFEYSLICRQATATGDAPQLGVNFTGTAAIKTMIAYWADATSAITAETHIMDDQGGKTFGYISGMANKAYSTTAPNMGTTVGVATVASDIPMFIKGVLIVTVGGDLELWHAAEGANASTIEVGSSLVVVRTK